MKSREELLYLLETFNRIAPTNWKDGQYRDFPGNKFIFADFSTKDVPDIKPAMEVIWSGRDFSQMISEIRNSLPNIIQYLQDPNLDLYTPSNQCKNCNHYQWQHISSCSCIDSWTPETGGCRCRGFVPKEA